jgi:hypothetical protein
MDVVLYTLAALILLMTSWVLFIPIFIIIDTDQSRYEIFQWGVFSVRFMPGESAWATIRIAGIEVHPERKGERNSAKREHGLRRAPSRWLWSRDWKRLARRLTRSIKLKTLVLDIDTDDYVLNARLIPLMMFASRGPCHFSVNFSSRNYLKTEIQFRIAPILWTIVLFLTFKHR